VEEVSPRYQFQVVQEFHCTYSIEAESKEEAWETLINEGDAFDAVCEDQIPGDITSSINEAYCAKEDE
jgi:hypothetical protein